MNKELLQAKTIRRVTFRYTFAVGLIAILAISTFLYNQYIHQRKIEDYQVINLTGRQRMLSQRIALLATNKRHSELKKAISEFRKGFNYLKTTRFFLKKHPEIQKVYEGIEINIDELIGLAISPQTEKNKEKLIFLSQLILTKFDQATLMKQRISEQEYKTNLRLEGLFLASTLILLILEVLFIFRPMSGEVREAFQELKHIEDMSVDSARLALIGHTAATIGHEIKNPLFAILAYSKSLGGSIENKLLKINKNAERIKKIIDALSIQARETSMDEKLPSALSDIISDALDVMDPRIKTIHIMIHREEKFRGDIICRSAAISQVIANLLANAIDAVKDVRTDKEIWIETGKEGDQVYVRISDSGPGVPVEIRSDIFKSFMTTKKKGIGSGLGLSFCKKIMQDHQGELVLRSDIGPSCFEIQFHQGIA